MRANHDRPNPEVVYTAMVGDCALTFNYTTQVQPYVYPYAGITIQPPPSSTKWSLAMNGPYPFGDDPTFTITHGVSTVPAGGLVQGVDRKRDSPTAGVTSYLVHFAAASSAQTATLSLQLFDVVYIDGKPTNLSHSVTISGDRSTAWASLVFPRYESALFYDPILTLAKAVAAASPSPASSSGGGGSGEDIGLAVGLSVGLGGMLLIVLVVLVVVPIVLVKRRNGGAGLLSITSFREDV